MNIRNAGAVVIALLCATVARAQLLPAPLPALPPPPVLREAVPATVQPRPVISSLRARARELMGRYPRQVERDPRGAPVVRAVILALSPDAQALQQALARGFVIQDDQAVAALGGRMVTLLVPRGLATERALQQLRSADPRGSYDFDHLFVESAATAPAIATAVAAGTMPAAVDVRVGLIDGGVDAAHPVFATRPPQLSGCGGRPVPGSHGTAVASLFVGRAPEFHGAAPGAELHAVDVYCGGDAPGGRVRDIVLALSALMDAQVRVINISVVGPDNAVLASAVRQVLARSIVIVAASGNDGPNARPLYPAAYPGVVAVSAVDARAKVLLEACAGEHVSFAAPGADMLAAVPGTAYAAVRGTSYAAPLVAGLIAKALATDGAATDRVIGQLAATARDLGRKGRDSRYGYGVVGTDLRTDPRHFAGAVARQ